MHSLCDNPPINRLKSAVCLCGWVGGLNELSAGLYMGGWVGRR